MPMRAARYQCGLSIAVLGLLLARNASSGQTVLTDAEQNRAIALGRSCRAPIIMVPAGQHDFNVYIESPFARIALVTAAAQLMNQPLEAVGVRGAMKPGYRIWLVRKRGARTDYILNTVRIRSRGSDQLPAQVRADKFFLGKVPSHGIIDALRDRRPEFTFSDLPVDGFEVLVDTSAGVQRYQVTQRERDTMMSVCTKWPL
jgi:hypothetical protein